MIQTYGYVRVSSREQKEELVFEDEPRDGGSETLVYYEDEGSSSIMYVNNVGKMYKTPK